MMESKPADLRAYPFDYQSPRNVDDVLIGEDTAEPLISASSTGDMATLRDILEHSPGFALESPHRIYQEDRPANDKSDVRGVLAMKKSNLGTAMLRAAENGHVTIVSTLLDFASQNGLEASSVIDRETIKKVIRNGHAAVFEVLAAAEPSLATVNILHGQRPLDLAIAVRKIDVAKVILQLGGGREFPNPKHTSSYRNSRLCQAARFSDKSMVELLLKHGYAVKGSGALHMAAERGALDTIRLLREQYHADVDERLPARSLPRVDNALFASWTPLHFAARWGREEAMELLERYGARTDMLDVNGKTASRLLEERTEAKMD